MVQQQSLLYHLEKPFKTNNLISAIFVGLNLRDEGKNFKGMTMTSVLPLVEILQKTCRLEVSSRKNGKGFLYFKNGILIDAHFKDLSGEEAARELTRWDGIAIKLTDLPQCRNRTRIKTHLMDIAGASWNQDPELGMEEIQLNPEYLADIISRYKEEFSRIQGYIALAVIDENGEVLASDQKNETFNLYRLAKDLKTFFPPKENAFGYISLQKGEVFTLHKHLHTVIILNPKKETNPRILLIGVASANGNWYFMKMNLNKVLAEIEKF